MTVRIAIETWDPEFGASMAQPERSPDMEPSGTNVDASVELDPSEWKPLERQERRPPRVVFIDGVQRIDALVWITVDGGGKRTHSATKLGIAASYAAGTVTAAESRATIQSAEVRRSLFTSVPVAELDDGLHTSVGVYGASTVAGATVERLSSGLRRSLRALEVELAGAVEADLCVVDGPLSARHKLDNGLGYVKTHHVSYLPAELGRVVEALPPGARTPLFLTTTSWTRYSSYLRLPGARAHPWADIVRIEIAADAELERAIALADLAAATLPRYASAAHKEPRAPQNLYPIGALERELRHRLGEARFVNRALRAAAARSS